jgi:hypothetical protein
MNAIHTPILLRQDAKPHTNVAKAASPPAARAALYLLSQRLRG